MNKIGKIILDIILIIAILGFIFYLVDKAQIFQNKKPIFILKTVKHDDGTTESYGIGYKIISYNKINGFREIKIGSYFLKYDANLGTNTEKIAEGFKTKGEKDTKVVEIKKDKIVNKDELLEYLDKLEKKTVVDKELKYITYTKEGYKIYHKLTIKDGALEYIKDYSEDKFAVEELKKNPVVTLMLETTIKTKEKNGYITFYSNNKADNKEIELITVKKALLRQKAE